MVAKQRDCCCCCCHCCRFLSLLPIGCLHLPSRPGCNSCRACTGTGGLPCQSVCMGHFTWLSRRPWSGPAAWCRDFIPNDDDGRSHGRNFLPLQATRAGATRAGAAAAAATSSNWQPATAIPIYSPAGGNIFISSLGIALHRVATRTRNPRPNRHNVYDCFCCSPGLHANRFATVAALVAKPSQVSKSSAWPEKIMQIQVSRSSVFIGSHGAALRACRCDSAN